MAWFRKKKKPKKDKDDEELRMPEGLWVKCENCEEIIYKKEVLRNMNVCPKCSYHFRISAKERLELLMDGEEYTEFNDNIAPEDPLDFEDTKKYTERLASYQDKTGIQDAAINVTGQIEGKDVIVAVMEYAFMGGSMGAVVGEKITRAAEKALKEKTPLIVISASGGARMQEGAVSLMQMAKVSAALSRLKEEAVPYISILTDPTTGGVSASFAMLGDINISEPRALICFAGPRVIKETINEELPEGFQRAEFLLEHGMLDFIVSRNEMKSRLSDCLEFMWYG